MSLHSTSRTSILRRGLVALAAAATMLAGGLVAAPAAQAGPVVDTSERDGTVITTRMNGKGTTIRGDVETDEIYPVRVQYWVDLDWTGGDLQAFEGEITLQRAGAKQVRRYPVTLDADGDRTKRIALPGTVTPGSYRVGIEFTAAVERPGGRLVQHSVDVNNGKTVPVQRQTKIEATIKNPTATDGRDSRITGRVRMLNISRDGDLTWGTFRSGTVILSYDPDGPWEDGERDVFVRKLTIGPKGWFSTVVPARDRWWYITYPGGVQWADDKSWLPQGDHSGCGC
ncbi:hypothetical protein APR04_004246 [Promicromonospora umidemergens]|uniref:Uncharacterized protein n=1 Tax=Promicromonospora umidemergens TaxID=629679 RepID=A0ABP8XRX3_9MICO|nr:hypothetical protein [Promicromonospora umidemergens]MCP2285314.1 hypothetical protein [Promicromonospora umidemergens]